MKNIRRLALVALAGMLGGCGDLGISGPLFGGGYESGTTDSGLNRTALFGTEPARLPTSLAVGARIRITVMPYGDDDRPGNHVQYKSDWNGRARWEVPEPPCPQNTCADLVAVSPGRASVGITVCPPEGLCPFDRTLSIEIVEGKAQAGHGE